jgi:replicative DNA helicase
MSKLNDIITEKVVLAGLYNHGSELYYDVANILNGETFVDDTHKAVFTSIQNLFLTKNFVKIDYPSFFATMNELGHGRILDDKSELHHIQSIINTDTEKENIKSWCIKLRKLQTARSLKDELQEANKQLDKINGTESFNEIIGIAESPIINFTQSLEISTSNILPIHDGINEYITYVEGNPKSIVGISTGYPILDDNIGSGIRKSSILLLGARTGFGKSLFSVNTGMFVASKLKIPVLYLDTEMAKIDHQPRLLSLLTYDMDFKVEIREIELGTYAAVEQKRQSVNEAVKILQSSPFYYLSLRGKSFTEHFSTMRKFLYRNVGFKSNGEANDCLIIYDYFKLHALSDLSNNLQERQILRDMMQQMHDFAGKYNIPILMLTQLNRDGIDKEDQGVIRGSDSALDPVTTFCIFKEKSAEEINIDTIQKGNSKIMILKGRHAEKHSSGNYISFMKIGKYGKIAEIKP